MKRNGKEPTIVPKSVWELVPKEDQADYDVKDRGDSVEVRYVSKKKTAQLNEQEEQDAGKHTTEQVSGPRRHSETGRETGPHQSGTVEPNGLGGGKRSPEGDEQPSLRRVPQPEVQGKVSPSEDETSPSGGLLEEDPDLKKRIYREQSKELTEEVKKTAKVNRAIHPNYWTFNPIVGVYCTFLWGIRFR